MKILHVIETLGVGGAERLLLTLLPAFRSNGDDVAVAVFRPPYDLQPELEALGISVFRLSGRMKWNLLARANDIAEVASSHGFSIIHAHLYFPAICTAIARSLHLTNAATVVTFHNLAYAAGVNRSGIGLTLRKWLASKLYPVGFDCMTAVSNAVADHYMSSLGLSNVDVVYNPLHFDEIDSLRFANSSHMSKCLHLVLPGRMVKEKGHADFLDALVILKRKCIDFRVTLAGGGPLQEQLADKVLSLGLSSCVEITGVVEHSQMLAIIADADIVVVPSRFEGFGLTAVEAMALSRPVVASSVGGLPEIIESNVSGMLVPSQSPEDLARMLSLLITDEVLRHRLGENGRKNVEEKFSTSAAVTAFRDIYCRAASEEKIR